MDDLDINGDTPTKGFSVEFVERYSQDFYEKAYYRVERMIDTREGDV